MTPETLFLEASAATNDPVSPIFGNGGTSPGWP
jgi:hypothetical protein